MPESNRGIQAANASWFAPLLTILCNTLAIAFKVDPNVERAIAVLGFAFILFGLAAAVYALVAIRTYGYRKILVPAIIGLTLNSAIVALLVNVLVHLPKRA